MLHRQQHHQPMLTTAAALAAAMLDRHHRQPWCAAAAAGSGSGSRQGAFSQRALQSALLLLLVLVAASLGQVQGAYQACGIKSDAGIAYQTPRSGLFVGSQHGGVVFANGKSMTWGRNNQGMLGDGTTTNSASPVSVAGVGDAVAAMASDAATCWLRVGGALLCSGDNDHTTTTGILGAGIGKTFLSTPTQVTAGVTMLPKTMGQNFYCVVKAVDATDDDVYCIGVNNAGQLGMGTTGYVNNLGQRVVNKNQFYKVVGLPAGKIASISCGSLHTCVAMASGNVYCWGDNRQGALGIGPLTASSILTTGTPQLVTKLTVPATQVACGGINGQTFTCALASNTMVYCWGANTYRNLGVSSSDPYTLSGGNYTISGSHLTAGNRFCAPNFGTWSPTTTPVCAMLPQPSNPVRFLPSGANITGVTQITAGGFHACALLSGGSVVCWGRNDGNQISTTASGITGTPWGVNPTTIPTTVTGTLGGTPTSIAACGTGTSSVNSRTTCVLLSNGGVQCWGLFGTNFGPALKTPIAGLTCTFANCTTPTDLAPTVGGIATSWSCPVVLPGDLCSAGCATGYEGVTGAPATIQCYKGPTLGQPQEFGPVSITGNVCTPQRCGGDPSTTGAAAVANGVFSGCGSGNYTNHGSSCTASCSSFPGGTFQAMDANDQPTSPPQATCDFGAWGSPTRTSFCKPVPRPTTLVYYQVTGPESKFPALSTDLIGNSGDWFKVSYNTASGNDYTAVTVTTWIQQYVVGARRRRGLLADPQIGVVVGFGLSSDPGTTTVATSGLPTTTEDLAHLLYSNVWQASGLFLSLSTADGTALDTPVAMQGCLGLPVDISFGRWPSSCSGRASGRTCTATCSQGYVGKVISTCQGFNWTSATGSCERKGTSFCPVDNCDTQFPGACSMVAGLWRCSKCEEPWVPNKRKTDCVCPAGRYITADGTCKLCKEGLYCPQGDDPTESPMIKCTGKLTSKAGAKSFSDCVNPAGFYYVRKSLTVARAEPCPDDTFSTGFDKAPACKACPAGFVTDPDNDAGSHTSAAVCVAPPGYFINGETIRACPIGSYQDQYGSFTECKSCEDSLGKGVVTPRTGSVSVNQCRVADAGYMLLDSGGKAIWSSSGSGLAGPIKITAARQCPQGYVCLGGSPLLADNQVLTFTTPSSLTLSFSNRAPGIPQACPNKLTTEKEGAYSFDQCVAPPGRWGDFNTAGGPRDCPSGSYKEAYARASTPAEGCVPCGSGLWLSERNFQLATTDLYGQLLKQELVRGSTDACYIQRGMGTERTLTNGALTAVICPRNTYGIIGDELKARKYGLLHTPCTACPANTITGWNNDADARVAGVAYFVNDAAGLAVSALLNGSYAEPTTNVSIAAGDGSAAGSGSGYFHVKACTNKGGSGYYNGVGQKCPQGFFNAPGNNNPCSQCSDGLTTGVNSTQASEASCDTLAAGYTVNGLTEKAPVPCPVGTYSGGGLTVANISTAYQIEQICKPCPMGLSTLETGATNATDCNICAPGFGGPNVAACNVDDPAKSALQKAAAVCQNGTYGPAGRSTTECLKCPAATRTFAYAWPTDSVDVFGPVVTSPPQAKSMQDCLSDFAQMVDGAFFLDLDVAQLTAVATDDGLPILGLQACVAECGLVDGCAAATYDYYTAQEGQLAADGTDKKDNTTCLLWKPQTSGPPESIEAGGMALKTMSAYTLSQSMSAKDTGSGWYSMYPGPDAAAAVPERIQVSRPAVTLVQDCLDLCTAENLCAGVIFGNYSSVAFACSLIMASREPGDSRRTLIKARFTSQFSPGCPPGSKVAADRSTCDSCPAGEYWDEPTNLGYDCKVCRSPGVVSSDRTRCLTATTTCPAGSVRNTAKPDECMACPMSTYKAFDDTGGVARDCENCSYTVSSDRTKCNQKAPCSRGLEWAEAAPGVCVTCELPGYYKDWADANATSPTKCNQCPDIGTAKFQNTRASSESCVNNCDGGYMYDDTSTATRIDPTKCTACPWPRVKAGPAGTACLGICDVDNDNTTLRTTPNSDRTACVKPVICPRGQEFDQDFPQDISKCKECTPGWANEDGIWLCITDAAAQPVANCYALDDNGDQSVGTYSSTFQQQNPNRLQECETCPFPFYKAIGLTTNTACRSQASGDGGTCGAMSPLTNGYGESSGVGRDVGNFWRTNTICYEQCGVDRFFDTASSSCKNCTNAGAIDGTARPHGDIGTNGAALLSCSTCTGGTVSYQGYCVTPVRCPINTQYNIQRPLSVEQCTICPAGTSNPTGLGRCV